MTFADWVDAERAEMSRTAFLREFAKKCGVSFQTLQYTIRGVRIKLYDKAEAISIATDREVSVQELCDSKVIGAKDAEKRAADSSSR